MRYEQPTLELVGNALGIVLGAEEGPRIDSSTSGKPYSADKPFTTDALEDFRF